MTEHEAAARWWIDADTTIAVPVPEAFPTSAFGTGSGVAGAGRPACPLPARPPVTPSFVSGDSAPPGTAAGPVAPTPGAAATPWIVSDARPHADQTRGRASTEREEAYMEWIFTFGFGQRDPLTGDSQANRFVRVEAVDIETARRKMIDRFGHAYPGVVGNWAFDYPSTAAAGVDRWGLVEIDFDTGIPAVWS